MGTYTMKTLVLLSVEAIKAGQDTIRKNLIKLDQSIHDNAVQCLLHAETHGDTSLMRRLLVEIVDAKSGYRRQGFINWMRKHSPMELKGDTINLSGMVTSEAQAKLMIAAFPDTDPKKFVVGERRPFLVEEANMAPFTSDGANREMVKPIFQNVLLSPIDAASKRFMTAIENTANGQPIDPSKPYYDGVHGDKILDFFTEVAKLQAKLPADATKEVRDAQKRIKDDTAFVASLTDGDVKDEGAQVLEPETKVA